MTSKLDDVLPAIKSASHSGVAFDALKKRFTGKSKASVAQLRETLDALVRKGAIRESIKEGRAEYHLAARSTGTTKAKRPEGLLTVIRKAEDQGVTLAELKKQLAGRSGMSEAELREELASLLKKCMIRTLEDAGTGRYFAADRGPSAQTVGAAVIRLVRESGLTLSTADSLKKRLGALEQPLLDAALEHALKGREIVALTLGETHCYLHRDIVAEVFALDTKPPATTVSRLTLEDVAPVYRRLKEEQGGFSGVKILDLLKALDLPKESVHPLLIAEAKAGRITIHRSSSVELPREVTDAGIRLPGFPEPFVTFAVKK